MDINMYIVGCDRMRRVQMWPTVADVLWSVCVCACVYCLFDITQSCDKTADPIEMPFGMSTLVGPGNHVGTSQDKEQFLGHPL